MKPFPSPASLGGRAARRLLPALAAAAMCAGPAYADTLHAAFESAWQRQPARRAQAERRAELEARLRGADALTPEPASMSLGQRSDQAGSRLGRRETEVEFAAPLWLPGQRLRQRAVAGAEGEAYAASQRLAQWRLAAEVREAWWQARLAGAERDLAQQRAAGAQALAADVARRVKAGELARVDANRAQAEEQSARIAAGEADARAFRAQQQFSALTGAAQLPGQDEAPGAEAGTLHPQRLLGEQQRALAQKRVDYAAATRRDPPELSLGVTRERATDAEAYASSIVLRLKIPFATDARNQPRMASALAEKAEAEASGELDDARIAAEIASAKRELEQARAALALSASRFELARDSQQLLDRAFKLGELDLPSRLRAEAERFEAERGLARATLEAGRAVSNLNQALGLLP